MAEFKANLDTTPSRFDLAVFKNIRSALLEFLFPAFCLGCDKDGTFLCDQCLAAMPLQSEQVCPYCYTKSAGGVVCANCQTKALASSARENFMASLPRGLDALIAASVYTDNSLMSAAIHALKYAFVRDLAVPLAKILFIKMANFDLRGFTICPVPLHQKRFKWRGFNQSELLADAVAAFSGMKTLNILKRLTYSAPQMELKKEARSKNVLNAFSCEKKLVPSKVLLIDDVATTLATLNECAKTLKSAGAVEVKALVLARAY